MSICSSEGPARFRTLVEALDAAPAAKPFVTMWHSEDDFQTVTFGEFRILAQAEAAAMASHGIQPGDRVVLVMPQGIAVMSAFAGALIRGAIPAILAYPHFKVDPAKYRSGLAGVARNLKAKLIIVDSMFPEDLMIHLSAADDEVIIWRDRAEFTINAAVADTHSASESSSIAFIQHSAGTTGLQKGVALSHRAVLRQLELLCQRLAVRSNDSIYSWLPLYHDMGLIACFMLPMACHLSVVMQSPEEWVMQPATMVEMIGRYRSTLAWVPNFTLQFLSRRVRRDELAVYDLSSLRAIINCSEPVTARSMDDFNSAYSASGLQRNVLQTSYAMAENVFGVTQSDPHSPEGPRRFWAHGETLRQKRVAIEAQPDDPGARCFVSSGKLLEGSEIQLVSAELQNLPDGSVGEIWIRSDSLFDGYYNRPDLTREAFHDGWYKTGDLGFVIDGEVFVIGRKKDVIIVGGQNIVPQDVEEVVTRHPEIHDGRAVALGIFNPDLGTEEIFVVAELNADSTPINVDGIERTVRAAVSVELGVTIKRLYLKPPRWLVKSTAGKPARSWTRDKLIAEHPELNRS